MLCIDTRFLAPPFEPEPRSHDVERFTDILTPGLSTVSRGVTVEFSSLIAKNVRMGLMTPVEADGANAAFDSFVARACSVLEVVDRGFDAARRLLADHRSGLRAGDALHLAVASNDAATGVDSLDRTMIAVGPPMDAGFPAAI